MVFRRADRAPNGQLQLVLFEFRPAGPRRFGTPDRIALGDNLPAPGRGPAPAHVETDFVEIAAAAPAMCDLQVDELAAAETAAPEPAHLPCSVAIAQRLVGDILARTGQERDGLERHDLAIAGPHRPPQTDLACRKAAGLVDDVAMAPAHGLPGQPAHQGDPAGQPVFEIDRRFVLVEITVIDPPALSIKGQIGPVGERCDDEQPLAAFLRPGAGRSRRRRGQRGEAGQQCQASKPGLSRRTRSSTAAQAISLKNSFAAIWSDWPKTRSCIFRSHSISSPPAWAITCTLQARSSR